VKSRSTIRFEVRVNSGWPWASCCIHALANPTNRLKFSLSVANLSFVQETRRPTSEHLFADNWNGESLFIITPLVDLSQPVDTFPIRGSADFVF
jgi:hypothetical protein